MAGVDDENTLIGIIITAGTIIKQTANPLVLILVILNSCARFHLILVLALASVN